jgi:AcrR family transcriptional regulator
MQASKASRARNFRGVAPEARQLERRERLMAAGIQTFGTRGYFRVTVREICAEARLTERYFYESFDNLEELFTAVYAQLASGLKQVTLEAIQHAVREPSAIAEAMLRSFFSYIQDDPRRGRIMFIDAVNIGHDVLRAAGTAVDDYGSLVRGFLKELFPAGAPGLRIDLLTQALQGACIQVATEWTKDEFRAPLEEVISNMLALCQGLLVVIERSQGALPIGAAKQTPRARSARAATTTTRR